MPPEVCAPAPVYSCMPPAICGTDGDFTVSSTGPTRWRLEGTAVFRDVLSSFKNTSACRSGDKSQCSDEELEALWQMACHDDPEKCCALHRKGVLCSECRDAGYYKMADQLCVLCPHSKLSQIFVLVFGYIGLAIFLDYKARDIKVQESGAVLGIWVFFFQSLALFGAFSPHSIIGSVALGLNLELGTTSGGEDVSLPECSLKMDPTESFFVTVVFIPVFLAAMASLVSFQIEHVCGGYVQRTDNIEEEPAEINPSDPISVVKRIMSNKYDSGHLRFFKCHTSAQMANFNEAMSEDDESGREHLQLWWTVSRIGLRRKQAAKHLDRVRFEVASFICELIKELLPLPFLALPLACPLPRV